MKVLMQHQAKPTGSCHCACGWRPAMKLNDTESDRQQHVWHQVEMLAYSGVLGDVAYA